MLDDNRADAIIPNESLGSEQAQSYERLVRDVTERVLQLLREDLRHERERRGKTGRRT